MTDILPQIVALRLKDKTPDFVLIDIRPAEERKITFIKGDTHIPAEKFDPTQFTDKEIVLYCRTGVRSGILAEHWQSKGFTNIKNLSGGIHAWSDKVDPTMPKYEHEH